MADTTGFIRCVPKHRVAGQHSEPLFTTVVSRSTSGRKDKLTGAKAVTLDTPS